MATEQSEKLKKSGTVDSVEPYKAGDVDCVRIKLGGRSYSWYRKSAKDIAPFIGEHVEIEYYDKQGTGKFADTTFHNIVDINFHDTPVESEDMSPYWNTGAPPTEEAKTVVSHSQPAPQPKTETDQYARRPENPENVRRMQLTTAFMAASDQIASFYQGEHAYEEDQIFEATTSLTGKYYQFLHNVLEEFNRPPPMTPDDLPLRPLPPDSSVEPQEQTEQAKIGEPGNSPRYQAYKAGDMSAADPSWTHPAESKRGESDFEPVSTALPNKAKPAVLGGVLDTDAGPTGQKPEPEPNPKLDTLDLWQTQVWQPYSEKTGRSGAELRGLANSVVAWFTEDPVTKIPTSTDAVEFFESKKKGEGDLGKYKDWLLEQTANYAHMLEQSQPKLIEQAEQQS